MKQIVFLLEEPSARDLLERPELAVQGLKAVHRTPDKLVRPIETIRKFIPEYQKRDGARRVGPRLDPARNQSDSFQAFCRGIRRIVADVA